MIPAEAVEAAVNVLPYQAADYVDTDTMRAALEAAAAHMLAGGKVTTEEELDALPVGSVVLSEEVTHHEGGWPLSYQRWQDGYWHRGARSGSTHPDNFLPALILPFWRGNTRNLGEVRPKEIEHKRLQRVAVG